MTRKLPPLNYLRAFEVAGKTRSFTKGATELNVTQSAISKQVQHLEALIGVPLFKRHIRSLELTRAGELLLARVGESFDLLEEGLRQIHQRHGKQMVNISMPPTFAVRIGGPEIIRFQKANPGVEIRIRIDNDGVDLDNSDIDVAVEFLHGRECLDTHQLLFEELLAPVCAPMYLADLPEKEILEQGVLLHALQREAAYSDWQEWLREAGHADVDYERGLVFDTASMALDGALQGAGIAISDINFVKDHLDQKTLIAPFRHWYRSGRGFYIRMRHKPAPVALAHDLTEWFMSYTIGRSATTDRASASE